MARILVVEDDIDVGPFVEHVLRASGYAVDLVASHSEAGARLDANSYDLVLADARLPDGSGLDIADAAKAQGVKTIVMTGFAFSLPAERLQQHECMIKPVRAPELVSMISMHLQAGRA